MRKEHWNRLGLATVILAPGGFVLGAALLVDRWRRSRTGRNGEQN